MRYFFLVLVVLIIFSCNKKNDGPHDLSGLYQDSLRYCYPAWGMGFVVKDTVIQKKVYKVNDSTYKMGALYNVDSNFLSPIQGGSFRLYWRITFVHRPDNTIIIKPEETTTASPTAYYDPVQQAIIDGSQI